MATNAVAQLLEEIQTAKAEIEALEARRWEAINENRHALELLILDAAKLGVFYVLEQRDAPAPVSSPAQRRHRACGNCGASGHDKRNCQITPANGARMRAEPSGALDAESL